MRLKGGRYLVNLTPYVDALSNESATYEDLSPFVEYVKSHIPNKKTKITEVFYNDAFYTSPLVNLSVSDSVLELYISDTSFDGDGNVERKLYIYLSIDLYSKNVTDHVYAEL